MYTTWRKSSYSGQNGTCVEVAWRKSSYSVENGSCVEVAFRDLSVGVRDSKNLASPHLTIPVTSWSRLVKNLR